MKSNVCRCLALLMVFAFTACPTTDPKKNPKKPATTSDQSAAGNSADALDFQGFIARLRKAVAAHDANAIASMMTVDFGYHLDPDLSGPGVFQYWDQKDLWTELTGILAENFVPKGDYMVAPPQFADPATTYTGYRAGIRRVNGSWKFAYFVNG